MSAVGAVAPPACPATGATDVDGSGSMDTAVHGKNVMCVCVCVCVLLLLLLLLKSIKVPKYNKALFSSIKAI